MSEAIERVQAFLDARDRFAASAREQGARTWLGNIAQQADTAAVLPPFYDAYDRPGSASYPLNTDDLRALLARVAELEGERDEARTAACTLLRYTGGPCAAWLFSRHLGSAKLPNWLTEPQPAAAPDRSNRSGQ